MNPTNPTNPTNPPNSQIRPAIDTDRQAWDDYVLSHPKGLAYQLYAWKDAVEWAYGFECPYFIALEGDRVCGVLPLAHIHLPLGKGSLVFCPIVMQGGSWLTQRKLKRSCYKVQ